MSKKDLIREIFVFASVTKKWWVIPLLFSILLLSTLAVVATSTGAAFIYALF